MPDILFEEQNLITPRETMLTQQNRLITIIITLILYKIAMALNQIQIQIIQQLLNSKRKCFITGCSKVEVAERTS